MLQCWQVGRSAGWVAKEGACPRGGPGRRLLGSLGVSGSSLASRPYLSDPQWPSPPAREAREALEAPGSMAEVPKALIWSPSHAACPACPVCSCCNSLFLSLHFSWHDLIGTEFSDPKPNPAVPCLSSPTSYVASGCHHALCNRCCPRRFNKGKRRTCVHGMLSSVPVRPCDEHSRQNMVEPLRIAINQLDRLGAWS